MSFISQRPGVRGPTTQMDGEPEKLMYVIPIDNNTTATTASRQQSVDYNPGHHCQRPGVSGMTIPAEVDRSRLKAFATVTWVI